MENKNLYRERLLNILNQLSSDQIEELFEYLLISPLYAPPGYPFKYKSKSFDELTNAEVKYLHDEFINLQFSKEPYLQNEDIRHVIVYPYKD